MYPATHQDISRRALEIRRRLVRSRQYLEHPVEQALQWLPGMQESTYSSCVFDTKCASACEAPLLKRWYRPIDGGLAPEDLLLHPYELVQLVLRLPERVQEVLFLAGQLQEDVRHGMEHLQVLVRALLRKVAQAPLVLLLEAMLVRLQEAGACGRKAKQQLFASLLDGPHLVIVTDCKKRINVRFGYFIVAPCRRPKQVIESRELLLAGHLHLDDALLRFLHATLQHAVEHGRSQAKQMRACRHGVQSEVQHYVVDPFRCPCCSRCLRFGISLHKTGFRHGGMDASKGTPAVPGRCRLHLACLSPVFRHEHLQKSATNPKAPTQCRTPKPSVPRNKIKQAIQEKEIDPLWRARKTPVASSNPAKPRQRNLLQKTIQKEQCKYSSSISTTFNKPYECLHSS